MVVEWEESEKNAISNYIMITVCYKMLVPEPEAV